MENIALVGIAITLIFGAIGLAKEKPRYEEQEEKTFLSDLSFIAAIGCVTGAIAVAILTPIYNGKIEALNQQIAALKVTPSPIASSEPIAGPCETPQIEPSPITNERVGGREFVQVSPEFLATLIARNTSVQGQRLVQGFIGKWLRVTGEVGNVAAYGDKTSVVSFYYYPRKENGPDFYAVSMWFDPTWTDRTVVLTKGTRITVEGKIRDVDSTDIIWTTARLCPLLSEGALVADYRKPYLWSLASPHVRHILALDVGQ